MFFKRFYDTGLAQASYMIACQRTGEAVVIDPHRDVDQYLATADAEGLRITHVTETHIHADFVSGARELARRAGARLLLSAEGGADWQYRYAEADGARLLRDGDHFMVGNVRIDVLHTPGHTPEHLSFLVTDTAAGAGPWGILTGDFVFVGDVGRPDLLEKAAGVAGTMEPAARTLFRSLEKFRALPDHLQVWPGHGAGSACGKALGAVMSSTVGYEKLGNWGVATTDEDEFVRLVLTDQPEPPRYFGQMKRINRDGPRVLDGPLGSRAPGWLPASAIDTVLGEGHVVIDVRPAAAYAASHIPGTLNIPLNASFTTWAGWLLPYDADLYLLIERGEGHRLERAVRDLAMIGLDRVLGAFDAVALEAWAASGRELGHVPQADVHDVARALENGSATVLDVRGRAEWEAGHLPGVENVPVGYLADRLDQLPVDRPIVLQCQSGARSAIAASVLLSKGVRNVANFTGGFVAWQRAGLPVVRDEPELVEAA